MDDERIIWCFNGASVDLVNVVCSRSRQSIVRGFLFAFFAAATEATATVRISTV